MELYTDYIKKYPKMSDNKYSIKNWQTDARLTNICNRFIRQDTTSTSIEHMEADDNENRKVF